MSTSKLDKAIVTSKAWYFWVDSTKSAPERCVWEVDHPTKTVQYQYCTDDNQAPGYAPDAKLIGILHSPVMWKPATP